MTGPCVVPDAAGDGAGSGGGIPFDMIGEAFIDAVCGYYVRCGVFDSQASCESVFAGFGGAIGGERVAGGIAAGTIIYDPVKAAECVSAFDTRACTRDYDLSERGESPACLEATRGTLAADAVCTVSEECVSQTCVASTNCPNNTCCGRCAPGAAPAVKQLGEPCTPRDICQNSYCEVSSPNSPTSFVCTAYRQNGAACTANEQCAVGSYCRNAGSAGASCQSLIAPNGPCQSRGDCLELSNVCAGGACRVGGTLGMTCMPTVPDSCQVFHYCGTTVGTATCALPPAVNEPCTQAQGCRGDAYCDGNVCQARKDTNAPCDTTLGGRDCKSGVCDLQGRCAAPSMCP